MKNEDTGIMQLEKISANVVVALQGDHNKELQSNQKIDILLNTSNIELKNEEEIKSKLNWEYEHLELSKIEGKSSVSKIKQEVNDELVVNVMKSPNFLKQETNKLTGAQKGTLIHLCMQNLDLREEYTKEKVKYLIEELQFKRKITTVEADNIDVNKILNFTESKLWKEVRKAKIVEREKPFYISIPVNKVYGNDIKEEILVQGIIDLYYINENDELILVDYKTDYVKEKEDLIEKYYKQLELYKRALEEGLNKKVSRVYIYSTCLEEEIII